MEKENIGNVSNKPFWNFVYNLSLKIQKVFSKWRKKNKNQRKLFHIGWLNSNFSVEDLKLHLHTNWGFGNHFISIIEEGEVLSWRKLSKNKKQYHLKVFEDGEIRGAFEWQPEKNFFAYFNHQNKKAQKEIFFEFLGDFIVRRKKLSVLEEEEKDEYEPSADEFFVPDPEVQISESDNVEEKKQEKIKNFNEPK